MNLYQGDYAEDATICVIFNTFSSNDPSASCTITNFANTDVHIHKDDDLTQRNNAAGITVSVDFDGITGSHMIKIDTNDNTVAGFWVTGKDYFIRIEGTTIDGATINSVVGHFSIENRFSEVDVVKWLGQACAAVTVNGVPEVDITHLLGTVWLAPGVAGTPDVNAKQLGGTAQTGRDVGANVLLSSGSGAGQLDFTSGVVKSNLAQILGTALTETAGWLAAGFKKLFNVATPVLVASDVMRGTDGANTTVPDAAGVAATPAEVATALTDINLDHLCKTATDGADMTTEVVDNSIISRIIASGDTSVFVPTTDSLQDIRDKLTDIETDTAEIGVAGAGLSDLGGMSTGMKAEVEAECTDAIEADGLDHLVSASVTGTDIVDNSIIAKLVSKEATADWDDFVNTSDSLQALRDRGDAAWTTGAGGSDRLLMVDTTIATLASQTSFTLTAGSADDDAYNNCTIVIEDASTAAQKAVGVISNYTGNTKTVTLKYDPAIFTMATTDKVYILAENALKSTLANRQLNVAADGDIAGNVDGSVASVTGHTAQTGDSYAIVNHADHGNAKLIRSTTPANKLDVSATGEAGLDFDNIKNATGAHTLTNITVPAVTALTGKTGFALSSTGADLILKNSTFALALADAMCDEVLTGATHNVVNSLGRKLREVGAYAIHSGTAQAGADVSITLAAGASAINGTYNRNLLVITDNTGVGQTRTIVDYDGSTKIAMIDREWRTNPDATTVYQIVADDTPLVSDQGVAQTGNTSTTIKLRDYASSTNDIYLCNVVIIVAGTGRGQARLVGAYDGDTKVVTICGDNWITTPDDTSVYVMIPYGASCACCICDYALGQINTECDTALSDYDSPTKTEMDSAFTEIKGGTWAAGTDTLEHIRDKETDIETDTQAIETDTQAIETDTQDIQSRIPAALSSGNIKADVLAISTSTDAADKLEASAETIIVGAAQTGTLSATEMTTDLTISVNDQMNGRILIFKEDTTTVALRRQATDITDSVTTNGKLTFTALTTAPVNGDTFIIV